MSVEADFARVAAALDEDTWADVEQAQRVIAAAAEAGDPRAMLLAALAAGAGYGRTRDFDDAVVWLSKASAAGNESARAQLAFLQTENLDTFAGFFSIAAWMAPRETRLVNDDPRVGMADGFLSARECAWLMTHAAPLQQGTLVYDPRTGSPAEADARTNTAATFTLPTLDVPTLLIRERIAQTMGMAVENFERTSVFRYQVGQRFTEHADYIATSFTAEIRRNGQRPLTFLVYLNDAFEGGETQFIKLGKKWRGRAGDALFFYNLDAAGQPNEMTMHEGLAPTSGEKWLLSQFIRDKAQLPG